MRVCIQEEEAEMLPSQPSSVEAPGLFQQLLPPARGTHPEQARLHPQDRCCVNVAWPGQLGGRPTVLVHVCWSSGEKQKQGLAGLGEVIWGNAAEGPPPSTAPPACLRAHFLFP